MKTAMKIEWSEADIEAALKKLELPHGQESIDLVMRCLEQISEIPDVRTNLVAQVRQEIAAGTYETAARISAAAEALAEELFPEDC